jgi:hypothetical protein
MHLLFDFDERLMQSGAVRFAIVRPFFESQDQALKRVNSQLLGSGEFSKDVGDGDRKHSGPPHLRQDRDEHFH